MPDDWSAAAPGHRLRCPMCDWTAREPIGSDEAKREAYNHYEEAHRTNDGTPAQAGARPAETDDLRE